MNLQQLEYIQALDKFRHFGRAADYCDVTQPTLSTMIQKLEEELGVKIFDRSHQPIIPTAVGRRILDQAAVILLQMAQVKEVIREETETLTGKVRLGVLPTVAPYPAESPAPDQEAPARAEGHHHGAEDERMCLGPTLWGDRHRSHRLCLHVGPAGGSPPLL